METRASYFLVGMFVLALVAGAFAFLMWLAKAELRDERIYYYIYFRGSVAGLQVGSTVQFRGVPVGSVTDIAIDTDNVELIQVTVALRPDTPVKSDSVASLQAQGITGLSFVQLSGGTRATAALEPRPGKKRAVIPSVPSSLERFFETAPDLVLRVGEVAVRANELLNDDNLRHISGILISLDRLSGTVSNSSDEIVGLVRDASDLARELKVAAASIEALSSDARRTLGEYEALARDMRGVVGQAGGDVDRIAASTERAIADLNATVQSYNRLALDLEQLVKESRVPVGDFAQSGLYEFTQFLVDARALIASLSRISAMVERDPARFLFGDQQRGIEAR
jgi:phospholipid/cholesterol/gamma-HCH transport system substrate-binding protein